MEDFDSLKLIQEINDATGTVMPAQLMKKIMMMEMELLYRKRVIEGCPEALAAVEQNPKPMQPHGWWNEPQL